MNLEKSLTYHFEDKDWLVKILIGGLVGVIPIVNLALLGYVLRALKNIAQGQEKPLPRWDEFGDHFVKGLKAFIGIFVYCIPILILACLAALFDGSISSQYQSSAGTAVVACFGCLGFLYGLLLGIVLPAALTKYAISEELASFFRFGEIFSYMAKNLGDYIIALIVSALVCLAALAVGGIACLIGVVFTIPWAKLVAAHLLAQVYKESLGQVTA